MQIHHFAWLSNADDIKYTIPGWNHLQIMNQLINSLITQHELIFSQRCLQHGLHCRSALRFFRCTSSKDTAAGVMPGSRDAMPMVVGRAAVNFCRTSLES